MNRNHSHNVSETDSFRAQYLIHSQWVPFDDDRTLGVVFVKEGPTWMFSIYLWWGAWMVERLRHDG